MNKDIKKLSNKDLETLYEVIKWKYDREDKSLYKRHLGGKLITILKEIKRRNNDNQ